MERIGKVVGGAQYVHKRATSLLTQVQKARLANCLKLLDRNTFWNVVKFDLKNLHKVSLLEYSDFSQDAFPVLLNGTNIDLDAKTAKHRTYSKSNPPVLHRKELLLPPDDPEKTKFEALTEELEELGAFINIWELGTKQHWRKRLKELGIEIINHEIRVLDQDSEAKDNSLKVLRHRTALKRKKLSSCMGALIDSSLVTKESEIFDYGCGRGDDIAILAENNFTKVFGWDPYFTKDNKIPEQSDFVTLSFVLNVIDDPDERHLVLKNAFNIASKALVFSVMLEHQNTLQFAYPYSDGYLTAISTFQKYYSAAEIEAVVKDQLNEVPIKLRPGVYIVFKEKSLEQEYLFKRQIGLLAESKSITEDDSGDNFAEKLVSKTVQAILASGRVPKKSELNSNLQNEISKSGVSYTRLSRLALSQISISELKHVRETFVDEVLIFLAINKLSGGVKYGELPPNFQVDVKAHFGSLKRANDEAERLLFSLSDKDSLLAAAVDAERARLGHLIGTKLRCRGLKCDKLPKSLRLFYKIGERLHRPVSSTDIVQLHLETNKMTYMIVDQFESSALPRLRSREIVNFSDQRIDEVFHLDKNRVSVLYRKSKLMDVSDRMYKAQCKFEDEFLSACPNLFDDSEPRFDEFALCLTKHKVKIPVY